MHGGDSESFKWHAEDNCGGNARTEWDVVVGERSGATGPVSSAFYFADATHPRLDYTVPYNAALR